MTDEKQAEAPATEDVADAQEMTPEQAWAEMTGTSPAQAPSEGADVDSQTNADAEDESDATAEPDEGTAVEEEDQGEETEPVKQSNKAENTEKRLRGQISGQSRKIHELQQKIEDLLKQGEDRAPVDTAKLREDYPEVVGPLLDEQEALRNEVKQLRDHMKLTAELQGEQIDADIERESGIVEGEHPGWLDFVKDNSDDFVAWVDDQPARLRAIYRDNYDAVTDGAALSELLASYKAHLDGDGSTEPAPDKGAESKSGLSGLRKRQMDGARAAPRSGAQAAVTEPAYDEQDAEKVWKHITK